MWSASWGYDAQRGLSSVQWLCALLRQPLLQMLKRDGVFKVGPTHTKTLAWAAFKHSMLEEVVVWVDAQLLFELGLEFLVPLLVCRQSWMGFDIGQTLQKGIGPPQPDIPVFQGQGQCRAAYWSQQIDVWPILRQGIEVKKGRLEDVRSTFVISNACARNVVEVCHGVDGFCH